MCGCEQFFLCLRKSGLDSNQFSFQEISNVHLAQIFWQFWSFPYEIIFHFYLHFHYFTLKVVFLFSYQKNLPVNSRHKLYISIIWCQKELRMPTIIFWIVTNNLGNMKNFYSSTPGKVWLTHVTIFILHLKNKITKQQAYPLYK